MLPKASRNSDPFTSHLAEQEVNTSGVRVSQLMQVVEYLKGHVGYTSAELAESMGIDRYTVARRLSDAEHLELAKKGNARKCDISKRMALTWYAAE